MNRLVKATIKSYDAAKKMGKIKREINVLRPFWTRFIGFNWLLGLGLLLLVSTTRVCMVLQANRTGNYKPVALIFLLMWVLPFVLLSKKGRSTIGLRRSDYYLVLVVAILLGFVFCTILYILGIALYDHTSSNWFVYIAKSYGNGTAKMGQDDKPLYFLIYSVTAMTFSPIGEELFYRGLVHESFVAKLGERRASYIDSLSFAVVHLAHFGLVYSDNRWNLLLLPSLLWFVFMFGAGQLFYWCKQKTDSLTGAILCHAAFNLSMMYFIFYHIF